MWSVVVLLKLECKWSQLHGCSFFPKQVLAFGLPIDPKFNHALLVCNVVELGHLDNFNSMFGF